VSACSDVEARLDRFVDSELSPSEQIDVARHLAGCPACNAVVERLLALRSGLAAMADAAVQSMPLAAVWPAVAAQAAAHDRRLWWRRGARPIRIAVPMWAAGVAMAAGALLVLRAVQPSADVPQQRASARRFATPAVIERVVGNVDVRHDLKSGAPIILVNHSSEGTAP
jgi:anti-sigma factor RsiW